jgi:hypothetical protein
MAKRYGGNVSGSEKQNIAEWARLGSQAAAGISKSVQKRKQRQLADEKGRSDLKAKTAAYEEAKFNKRKSTAVRGAYKNNRYDPNEMMGM